MTIINVLRRTALVAVLAGASLTTVACKKSSDCDAVFDHIVSLAPAGMADKMKEGKADGLAKCEKMKPESRQCALDAKSMEDLMKCPRE